MRNARSPLLQRAGRDHVVLDQPAFGIVVGPEAFDQDRPLAQRPGALGRGHDHGARAVAVQAAIEQPERLDNHPRVKIVVERHRLLHGGVGIAQRVLAEGDRDGREIVAGRAVFVHVAPRAEGMLRRRAKVAELGTVLARPLIGGDQLILLKPTPCMRARPAVAAVTADHRCRETRLDRHDRHDDRKNLACAAVVDGRAEGRVDAEPARDQLMMGVDVVGPSHDEAVHVLVLKPGVLESALDCHLKQAERAGFNLTELAVAGADNRVFVPHCIHSRHLPSGPRGFCCCE